MQHYLSIKLPLILLILFLIVIVFMSPVWAVEIVKTFSAWSVAIYKENNKEPSCFAYSKPISEKGDYTLRGDVFFYISNFPKSNIKHQISVDMGYPIKNNHKIKLTIDKKKNFFLAVLNKNVPDFAYANKKNQNNLIQALRHGSSMTVYGASRKNTKTTDTYSLKGVIKSLNELNKVCT